MNYNKINLNGTDYIEATPEVLKLLEPKKLKKKFEPKPNEQMWYVYKCTEELYEADWVNCDSISFCLNIVQNDYVFATKANAEAYIRYLTAVDKHSFEPDWKDFEQKKYCIYYNYITKKFVFSYAIGFATKNTYFPAQAAAEAFIAEAGESTVKNFMFDIWEE